MGGEPGIKNALMLGRHRQGRSVGGDVIPKVCGKTHFFGGGEFVHFLSEDGIHEW